MRPFMNTGLQDAIGSCGSWEEIRTLARSSLKLNESVSDATLIRFIGDLTNGGTLPGKSSIRGATSEPEPRPGPGPKIRGTRRAVSGERTIPVRGSIEVTAAAAVSMIQWAVRGFSRADAAEFKRRYHICCACPNIMEPPNIAAYKLAQMGREDRRICSVCGCFVAAKAARATARCPDMDPKNPHRNRWGQKK